MTIHIKVTHASKKTKANTPPNAIVLAQYKGSGSAYHEAILAPGAEFTLAVHDSSEIIVRETEDAATVKPKRKPRKAAKPKKATTPSRAKPKKSTSGKKPAKKKATPKRKAAKK